MIDVPVHQEILFIDEFLHQNSVIIITCILLDIILNFSRFKNVHWDHVKFNHPVYLDQIRIIPKDCFVSMKNGVNRTG